MPLKVNRQCSEHAYNVYILFFNAKKKAAHFRLQPLDFMPMGLWREFEQFAHLPSHIVRE